MGQILHGSATTTEAIRRAIQNSQASLRELAARHGINPKTVVKWRRRSSVCDAQMGPRTSLHSSQQRGRSADCRLSQASGEEVVQASDYRALQDQVRELHRVLGKKTVGSAACLTHRVTSPRRRSSSPIRSATSIS